VVFHLLCEPVLLGLFYTFFCTIICHQFNRRKFVSPTTYLIYNLLPFRRGSVPARSLCVFLFFLSLVFSTQATVNGWRKWRGRGEVSRLWRILGWLWVSAWIAWCLPGWVYPALRKNRDKKNRVVPMNIIELFMS